MQKISRPRRYVSSLRLYAMLPALRYSHERGAYVLRFVGETRGPVLRKDRRRGRMAYTGPERRLTTDGTPLIDPAEALRPAGGVRIVPKTSNGRSPAEKATPAKSPSVAQAPATQASADEAATGSSRPDASRRRPQHGRQRPPRPRH
jgi:hypothetical protein